MDSIATSLDGFPPDIVRPGTSFSNLTPDEIHERIASHKNDISKLKDPIYHHKRAIARYRGSLNEIVPSINKTLPMEIFSEIFLQYRTLCAETNSTKLPFYVWLKVAHVCRFWRNIILATPLLFNRIDIHTTKYNHHPSRTKEFLRISNKIPLHVTLNPYSYGDWEECLRLLPRTHTLEVADLYEPFYLPSGGLKWPVCPVLSFLSFPKDHSYVQFDPDLRDIMPNLQYLSICAKKFVYDWPLHSLPHTLKTLILFPYYSGRKSVDPYDMLRRLAALPQLENLCVRRGVLSDPPGNISPSNIKDLQLGHFKCLDLCGHVSSILLFLQYVRSFDRIKLKITDASTEDLLMLTQSLKTKLTPIKSSLLSTGGHFGLVHAYALRKGINLNLLLSGNRGEDKFPFKSYHVEIRTTVSPRTSFIESLISTLSSHFAFVTDCDYAIEFDDSGSDSTDYCSTIQTILFNMPSITHLSILPPFLEPRRPSVSYIHCSTLFSTILNLNREYNSILPRLRELHINVDGVFSISGEGLDLCETYLGNLRDALQSRKEHGIELLVLNVWVWCVKMEKRKQWIDLLTRLKSLFEPLVGNLIIRSSTSP
ncbi:hypothetical protein QCA50_008380 [Cerrena zonata]|uniref:F-box domain-containing protein n=1 Tax=Cerrena zonata TaxID=2478898 RepID=A0AAW0GA44_9APHY